MTDQDFDFDAWLDGAAPTTTSVDILQNPSLLSDYESWQRRYTRARNTTPAERSAAEPDPVRLLESEGEELLEQIEQSRSVWHIRALTAEDERAVLRAFPDPKGPDGFTEQPPRLTDSPTEAQAKAYSQGFEAWQKRQHLWIEAHRAELDQFGEELRQTSVQRGAERMSRAVVRIEQGERIINHITADQAARLPERIGEAQVKVLLQAISRASTEVPEVPAGPLSRGSGDDPE